MLRYPWDRTGKILTDICTAFKAAEIEVSERALRIEYIWLKTRTQLDFLTQIWKALDDEHLKMQIRILRVLINKLETAIAQIERVQKKKRGKEGEEAVKGGEIKRLKYALIKDTLDSAIQDLESWQKLFDPSWFLIMKIGNPLIDEELSKDDKEDDDRTEVGSMVTAKAVRESLKTEPTVQPSVFLPENELASSQRQHIPYCTAELLQRTRKAKTKLYILDSVICLPEVNINILTKDVRDLARKLKGADPLTFGLLQCSGVVKVFDIDRKLVSFDFVFYIPEGLKNPQSLRHILVFADDTISLSDRFRIAQQLAQSVSYVHTYGFVHKSIRPDNVLVFQSPSSVLGSSFLLGFEKFRTADGRTLRAGDCAWEKELYRHPRRQGLNPEDEYSMQHDIYSLGVCLLEIGLWESFVDYPENNTETAPSPILFTAENSQTSEDPAKKASLVKDALVGIANDRLPCRMGDKYTRIVVTCLTCLDETNEDFGDENEFKDEDDISIGVRYIEKVSRPTPCRISTLLRDLDLTSAEQHLDIITVNQNNEKPQSLMVQNSCTYTFMVKYII